MPELVLALAKGRLMDRAVERLQAAGIHIADLDSRKLRVSDADGRYDFLLVKPADVPIYVEYGAADAGICGRDVLMEAEPDVYEPLDLGFGYCRLVVAGRAGATQGDYTARSTVRIATKYPLTAQRFFHGRGVPVEVIQLSGSIELAPLVGLSDHIVDLVETGTTLRDNGLEILDVIAESTARLIVNRAAFATKRAAVTRLMETLRAAFPAEAASGRP